MSVDRLIDAAKEAGLDGIALTDHNTMAGAQRAEACAPADFAVIPGEEIDTTDGQLIGLFLSTEIRSGQSPTRVIGEIHDQGGLVVAPHPFDRLRSRIKDIDRIAGDLDAIEVLNSRCFFASANRRATRFANSHDLPSLGGSDAHFAHEVGRAYTEIDTDATDLGSIKESITTGDSTPVGSRGSNLNHVGTKLLKLARGLR